MPLPSGDQTSYYPAAKLKLHIRFEAFDKPPPGAPPRTSILRVKGIDDDGRTSINVVADPNAPTGVRRYFLQAKEKGSSFSSTATSSDGKTFHLEMIPKKATWKQKNHREADELSFDLQGSDFPFDPRTLRSIAVELFLGTISPEEYAGGSAGLVRNYGSNPRQPLTIIPDTYLDRDGRLRTNLRFQGWVEKYARSWKADGVNITLDCKDNSTLLINNIAAPKGQVDCSKPIDQAIAAYLAIYPQFRGLSVEYRGTDDPVVLNKVLATTAYSRIGPPVAKGGGGATGGGGDKFSVYDYLTEVCGTVGLIVRVENQVVVIQKPTTLLGDRDGYSVANRRPDDPYIPRSIDGDKYPNRTYIFGKNILELGATREYTRNEPKNLELRCYDTTSKKTLVARHPLQRSQRLITVQPGDGGEENKWTVKFVTGVKSQALLQEIARQTYEQQTRKELEFSIKTKNLSSFGGDNEDPDLLDIKIGDVVLVRVDRIESSELSNDGPKLESSRIVKLLTELGYTQELAQAYNDCYKNSALPNEFKTREVETTFDIKEGVSFDLKVVDFVVVRVNKGLDENVPSPARPAINKSATTTQQPAASAPHAAKSSKGHGHK